MLTDYLFARPSFLSGVAHILDFRGTLKEYNSMPTAEDADERAFLADWNALCADFRQASVIIEQNGKK